MVLEFMVDFLKSELDMSPSSTVYWPPGYIDF